jgi:hypothetical protein
MALQFNTDEELVAFVLKQKLPEWQKKLFKRNAEAIQVHSQGQIFFKLDRLFPNEASESKDHRILAFESVTEASFGKAVNNINRIFKNTSYSFEASDKSTEQAEQLFEGDNFFQWFLDEWTTWALKEDANSRIAVYPPEYVKDGYEPICFISSDHLLRCDKDAVVFISEKESDVDYETEEVRIHNVRFYDQSIGKMNFRQVTENTFTPKICTKIKRPVYHAFINEVGFYRIEQLQGSTSKYQVDFYPFPGDMIPVTDVGGEKSSKDVNKSFLNPFVAFGNLALLQHSQHTAVNFTFSFPRMSEIFSPCDDPLCKDGWIDCDVSKDCPDGKKTCGKCGGSGQISNQTPYKSYIKRFDPQGMEGDDKILEVPHVQFYTPDTSILDYSKAEWKNYLEMAERAVYVTQKVQTGNVESADSKSIDRDDMYAFLSRIAKVYYSKIKFVLQAWENYFYSNPDQVTIEVPYSFAILQEDEAFAGLKDILASNIPVMLKASQVESFVNKFLSQNSPIRKFLDVLKITDPLLFYNSNEITSFKLNGAVSPEQMTAHVFSFPVLQKMYFEDPLLFMQDTKAIIKKVETELQTMVPEQPVDLKTKLLQGASE